MDYTILCNEVLKLDSKIRFAGILNSRGELAVQKKRDASSLLSADEVKMSVHYTFARWADLQNLEYKLGKGRISVTEHEKVTLITLYLDAGLLLLSIEPDYNYTKIIKKIRTMLDDGGSPSEKRKQTNKGKKIPKVKKQPSKKNVTTSKSAQKTRKIRAAVKRKAATTAKSRKTVKRSKPASKAKRRATLVANKRKRELEKANNKIKSLKKAIRLAEKSAKKKKTTYQQAATRASQTR